MRVGIKGGEMDQSPQQQLSDDQVGADSTDVSVLQEAQTSDIKSSGLCKP